MEPTTTDQGPVTTPTVDQGSMDKTADEKARQDAKLSEEAAKWRTKFRELEAQLKDLAPKAQKFDELSEAQKSAEQKLAEKLQAMEAKAAAAEAKALKAERDAQISRWAAKAGVPDEVLALLDSAKIPDDEKDALEMLGKLVAASKTAGASNPGRSQAGPSDDELRKQYFGGGRSKPTIFGG